MNIENMSDEKKSVMLAKLMGWSVTNVRRDSGAWCRVLCDENKTEILPTVLFGGGVEPKEVDLKPSRRFNLYDPANMALALHVIRWAFDSKVGERLMMWLEKMESKTIDNHTRYAGNWFFILYEEDGISSVLDKILSLLIEAEMLEDEA